MEQNKQKLTKPAAFARQGHTITWQLSDGRPNGRRYPAAVVDGKVYFEGETKMPWNQL